MDSHIHAGIEFEGSVLRYAEVERVGESLRLLRLGECDFSFEPLLALRDGGEVEMDILQEALRDVFEGSEADGLRVAFHPSDVLTWMAPFDRQLPFSERNARLRQESALMAAGQADASEMNLTMQPLYTTESDGAAVDWVQVVALPKPMHSRVEQLGGAFKRAGTRVGLSTQGAAAALGIVSQANTNINPARPLACGIGLYEQYTEYAVARAGKPLLSSAGAPVQSSDALFSLLRVLQQVGHYAQEVSHLYVYGTGTTQDSVDAIPRVMGFQAMPINPLHALMTDDSDAADPYEASAYAPSVGIAL